MGLIHQHDKVLHFLFCMLTDTEKNGNDPTEHECKSSDDSTGLDFYMRKGPEEDEDGATLTANGLVYSKLSAISPLMYICDEEQH